MRPFIKIRIADKNTTGYELMKRYILDVVKIPYAIWEKEIEQMAYVSDKYFARDGYIYCWSKYCTTNVQVIPRFETWDEYNYITGTYESEPKIEIETELTSQKKESIGVSNNLRYDCKESTLTFNFTSEFDIKLDGVSYVYVNVNDKNVYFVIDDVQVVSENKLLYTVSSRLYSISLMDYNLTSVYFPSLNAPF